MVHYYAHVSIFKLFSNRLVFYLFMSAFYFLFMNSSLVYLLLYLSIKENHSPNKFIYLVKYDLKNANTVMLHSGIRKASVV